MRINATHNTTGARHSARRPSASPAAGKLGLDGSTCVSEGSVPHRQLVGAARASGSTSPIPGAGRCEVPPAELLADWTAGSSIALIPKAYQHIHRFIHNHRGRGTKGAIQWDGDSEG